MSVLKLVFAYAQDQGYISQNIKFSMPRINKPHIEIFSKEDEVRLLSYSINNLEPSKCGVIISLCTGIRIGELCALQWSDIDIGYEQGGFLGALLATIGVVLPSFIVILIVAAFIKNLLKYPPVKTFIASMRPALGGLILSVAVTMALTVFFGIDTVKNIHFAFDWRTFVVLAVVVAVPLVWKRFKKKEFSSILLVVISGVLGMVLFGF